jgi:hypothetical protein
VGSLGSNGGSVGTGGGGTPGNGESVTVTCT